MKMLKVVFFMLFFGCNGTEMSILENKPDESANDVLLGADLSYVNEMVDCGANYTSGGKDVEPYQFFAAQGCDMVRVRLWHSPEWTNYSNFLDVEKTIRESKSQNMQILLDFHFSDTWADPQKQLIPAAWASIQDLDILGDSLYNYTYQTLHKLNARGLAPEIVQIGNEINVEIMLDREVKEGDKINWERNAFLLNKGLEAVTNFNAKNNTTVESMLHIAQPENLDWFFSEALENKVTDFNWIGLSYYPKWSSVAITELAEHLEKVMGKFNKELMIVETAYPYTLKDIDDAGNILGKDATISLFEISPAGQLAYLTFLKEVVISSGAKGLIYWEPAWVSSDCSTLWGQGSHWDNATFFDNQNHNEALEAFAFFK